MSQAVMRRQSVLGQPVMSRAVVGQAVARLDAPTGPRAVARPVASAGRRAVARPDAPAGGSCLRLTRRGRVVIVLATLLVLVVGGLTLGRASSQAAGPSAHRPLPTVTVAPGETLWQIAARVDPGADRRALVDQIESLNNLHDGRVIAGQQLRLPRR